VAVGRASLTQAVFNLVQNAGDALRGRGSGRVTISVADDPQAPALVLRVTDDGPGMTQEVLSRCLEPYFSTKSRGMATGMGLSIVHGLVTGAGGRVEIESAVGRGTTISLLLPRSVAAEPRQATPPRVAVVDMSDARIRSFVISVLHTQGFEVHGGGESGLEPCLLVVDPAAHSRIPDGLGTQETRIIVVGDPAQVHPTSRAAELVVVSPDSGGAAIVRALRKASDRDRPQA
jgi:hypothetical protein